MKRAKTAANGLRNTNLNIQASALNINRINFPRAEDEYEAFRINNDVRKHMQKYLRPAS